MAFIKEADLGKTIDLPGISSFGSPK